MNQKEVGPLKSSVRGLVAFSVFPPDITPASGALMELGRQGHLARQGKSTAQAETALHWEGEAEGCLMQVSGRMDLYDADSFPPLIEEIKLSGDPPPQSPLKEHLLQAVCYGFILSLQEGYSALNLRISYVTPHGELTAEFLEHWTFEQLRAAFFELLIPWVQWQKKLISHRARRDASLETLPFPYPTYRPGQREMAAQVYTAIQRRKRLYAVMPTGTGKSAAVLYPALKALGQGLNEQIFCLTARGTQRLAMQKETELLRLAGLKLFSVVLSAKEKMCPRDEMRCDPDFCPRAKGHYIRQKEALKEALDKEKWDTEDIIEVSNRYELCPFEFSLALSELADLVICDYNYALDPQVRLNRIFDNPQKITLLIDEAHNLPDRARDMLSGEIRADSLRSLRLEAGKTYGRSSRLYRAYTKLLNFIAQENPEDGAQTPEAAVAALIEALGQSHTPGGAYLTRDLIAFLSALERAQTEPDDYHVLHDADRKTGRIKALCLNPAPYLNLVTRRMAGCVYYSATLSPLDAMRDLLGGESEDACLSLPSPFPKEHLLTLQLPLNTRYQARPASVQPAARAILARFSSRPGKYIAYFPSFAYLREVASALTEMEPRLNMVIQQPQMDEDARSAFLGAFTKDEQPLLGLCVLGGVFAEGVDLPGKALIGAAVIGAGLPQVNPEREFYRARMEETLGDGFGYAYRYPGMHKVLQAAGRLIRSETDRGVLLLIDDRYKRRDYASLLPEHFTLQRVYNVEEIKASAQAFWAIQTGSGGDKNG